MVMSHVHQPVMMESHLYPIHLTPSFRRGWPATDRHAGAGAVAAAGAVHDEPPAVRVGGRHAQRRTGTEAVFRPSIYSRDRNDGKQHDAKPPNFCRHFFPAIFVSHPILSRSCVAVPLDHSLRHWGIPSPKNRCRLLSLLTAPC